MKRTGTLRRLLATALLGVLLLAGCQARADRIRNGREENTPVKFSMTYDEFTGHREARVTVGPGQTVEVAVMIVTHKGSLDAYIKTSTGQMNYTGRAVATSSFTVLLKEPGSYTIGVDGKNHSGSYSFSWQ